MLFSQHYYILLQSAGNILRNYRVEVISSTKTTYKNMIFKLGVNLLSRSTPSKEQTYSINQCLCKCFYCLNRVIYSAVECKKRHVAGNIALGKHLPKPVVYKWRDEFAPPMLRLGGFSRDVKTFALNLCCTTNCIEKSLSSNFI